MKVVGKKYITTNSIVDGEGLRFVFWFQGCSHKCLGCHNPSTHSFDKGCEITIDEAKKEITKWAKSHNGITFSGGDPFYQTKALYELVKYSKSLGLNIWIYTGFMFENLLKDEFNRKILELTDVLVDGPFVLAMKSLSCLYRGSTNQRLIDCASSLASGEVISWVYKPTSAQNEKDPKIFL